MKIICLIDNIASGPNLACEHGLSYYIEACGSKVLFDTGASGHFVQNAETLGIDLSNADIAVVSHGHYDHGGGLPAFFARNKKAPVYIRDNAFEDYYSERVSGTAYIGLDKTLPNNGRFIFTSGQPQEIAHGFTLFSLQKRSEPLYSTNAALKVKSEDSLVPDRFLHEQNMTVEENGKRILIAGCAHNEIINILDAYKKLAGGYPDVVFGGFHLSNPGNGTTESPAVIARLADKLQETGAIFYTGHCTGTEPFQHLKKMMGGSIRYFAAGNQIEL